jgi:hypothetical protein
MLPMLFGAGMLSGVLIVGVERIVAWAFWVLVLVIPPLMATLGVQFDSQVQRAALVLNCSDPFESCTAVHV